MRRLEEYEIDFDDLMDEIADNALDSKNKSFSDIVNVSNAVNREIFIGDISYGIGSSIDIMIRFWNRYDDEHDIPVEEREPIKILIDSNGGSLTDSFTIIDSIKNSKTPVEATVVGTAYSGGFFILISCPVRKAYKHASFLFHEGSTSTGGTAGQFENYTAFYKKQLNQLKDIVISNTNITAEEYSDIKKDDIWYDSQEALEKGIIDEII